MAHEKFPARVLTPEGLVFDDQVEMVSTRTVNGSIGILAHHAPLLGVLQPTELKLYRSENDVLRFAQGEGYIQMQGNEALVLVEEIIEPKDLDESELQQKIANAQAELADLEEDSEGYRKRARDKQRYETFLEIAATKSE